MNRLRKLIPRKHATAEPKKEPDPKLEPEPKKEQPLPRKGDELLQYTGRKYTYHRQEYLDLHFDFSFLHHQPKPFLIDDVFAHLPVRNLLGKFIEVSVRGIRQHKQGSEKQLEIL
jgi:hypothetical protein